MNEEPGSRIPRSNGEKPTTSIADTFRGYILRLMRPNNGENTVRGALEELIEEHPDAETPLDEEQRTLLENILNLRDRTIADVMVPRADIIGIDVNATLEQIIELINEEAHSRVPVFHEALDDAVGMVHIKDVLAAQQKGGGISAS